jgi:hypothetical protein
LLLSLGTPQPFSVSAVGAVAGRAEVTHGFHPCKGFHHRVAAGDQARPAQDRAPTCG